MSTQSSISFPDARKGYRCSSCGGYVKEYCRSFNSNMAIALIALYKHTKGEYVHLEKFLAENGYQRCGDASYNRFYGLLEPFKGKREDNSPRNGYYRITGMGRMFVENKTKVFSKFKIQHNAFQGFEGKEISIHEALGEKFSYEKLMTG